MCAGLHLPPSQRHAATTLPNSIPYKYQLKSTQFPQRTFFFSLQSSENKQQDRIPLLCEYFLFFSHSSLNPHKVDSTFMCVRETERMGICRWWADSHSGRLSSAGLFLEETLWATPSWAVPLLWLMPPCAVRDSHTHFLRLLRFIYICLNLSARFHSLPCIQSSSLLVCSLADLEIAFWNQKSTVCVQNIVVWFGFVSIVSLFLFG